MRLSDFAQRFERVSEAVHEALDGVATVVDDPGRETGRGYYAGYCFKVYAVHGDARYELSDGGLVDWTQQLLQNRKERLVISGIGTDRLLILR